MPAYKLWPIIRPVHLRPQHGAEIADTDLHRIGRGALCLTGDVEGRPGEHEARGRVDACCSEEHARVRQTGASHGIIVGEEEDVTQRRDKGRTGDEEAAALEALRCNCDRNGGSEGEGIGWDGEELGSRGGVAEVFNNGWLMKAS